MFNKEILSEIEKKIAVSENPFPNAIIENFFPLEIAKEAEEEFKNYNTAIEAGVRGAEHFQKTKRFSNRYEDMPYTIKKIIDFLYSKNFINILEKKFNLKNVEPDWTFHGGGLHESFNGGFLKIHSDFIYMRDWMNKTNNSGGWVFAIFLLFILKQVSQAFLDVTTFKRK